MKKRFLLLTLIITTLIFASSCKALYDDLASSYAPNNIETLPKSSTTTTPAQNTTSGTGEQTPSENNPTEDNPTEDNPTEDDPIPPAWNGPDFTVLDKDGNEIKLSDLAGKPIVLNFWATWCGYCVEEMPDFQTAYETYTNVQFVMVNVTDGYYETIPSAKEFVAKKGFTFPIYFDTKSSATSAFGVNAYPQTFFIDETGNIVAKARGAISLSNLEYGISLIVNAE
ncbi:MAG: TlpA family protein disulfide reductase [Clostridia bacterium]|nr:TlpA family protein disulfide reductase [Clostridia bacterium]